MSNFYFHFRLLSQILCPDNPDPERQELQRILGQPAFQWQVFMDLVNAELLAPAVWTALREKQLATALPNEIQAYLEEIYSLNAQRNAGIVSQAHDVIALLNARNIIPTALKGSTYLLADMLEDPAQRMMYDLDLLVPAGQLAEAVAALKAAGYESDPAREKKLADHHHAAPLYKPGVYAAIELHHEVLHASAARVLKTRDCLAQAVPIYRHGLQFNVLCPEHQVLHNVLHAEIVDRYYERHIIKLRSLLDLQTLIASHRQTLDWAAVQATLSRHSLRKVLNAYLYLAHRILRLSLPAEIAPGWRSHWYYLRCLAGMRWDGFLFLEKKLLRFSRYEICQRYHCEDDDFSVFVARLQYTWYLLTRWVNR